MKKKLFEQIVLQITAIIVTSLAGLLISTVFNYKGSVEIGNVVRNGKDSCTLIDFKNYQSNTLKDILIKVPDIIDLNEVMASQPLELQKQSNNIVPNDWTELKVGSIPSNSSVSLFFKIHDNVDSRDIVIDKNGNNLDIIYAGDRKNPLYENIKLILIYVMIYSVIIVISNYWLLSVESKRQKLMEERLASSEKEMESFRKQSNDIIKEAKRNYASYKKAKLLLLARINDYSKELSFWRDTIRKILCNISKEKQDEIIRTITGNLRTYQTSNWDESYFESLDILTNVIKKDMKDIE
jgi:hypothetical protein